MSATVKAKLDVLAASAVDLSLALKQGDTNSVRIVNIYLR